MMRVVADVDVGDRRVVMIEVNDDASMTTDALMADFFALDGLGKGQPAFTSVIESVTVNIMSRTRTYRVTMPGLTARLRARVRQVRQEARCQTQ